MFGLVFRFPTGRYHATPWGRNVNEADVAWPPEPWRILRALVATYWRKGDRGRWSEDDLSNLIEALAEDLPVFRLPVGAIHSHTRHYLPIPKGKLESKTLVFDAFLHLPDGAEVEVMWPSVTLDANLLGLAADLASGVGYLGRAESWTECRVLVAADGEPNCQPAELGFPGEPCRVLAPRSTRSYHRERARLVDHESTRVQAASNKPLTERVLQNKVRKSFQSKGGVDTLPARLLDAISLDTVDLQNRKWDRPPAAYEVVYARDPRCNPGVLSLSSGRPRKTSKTAVLPTVARFLLAGRPRPRIEDAIKIGEVMRAGAMSKFGWETDEATGTRHPLAPWQISGRRQDGRPVRDPTHPHAFWLPEDADDDGWIDHMTVYVAGGMDEEIQSRLDRITRIWLTPKGERGKPRDEALGVDEWRLALEGFADPQDFDGSSRILGGSRRWRSVTPFLASGHLKKQGYRGEMLRLLGRRGIATAGVRVRELSTIDVGGTPRRALNFHRFRSNRRELQPDSRGALIEIEFPRIVRGPLALGYGSHFGLGMFGAIE